MVIRCVVVVEVQDCVPSRAYALEAIGMADGVAEAEGAVHYIPPTAAKAVGTAVTVVLPYTPQPQGFSHTQAVEHPS